MMVKVLCFLLGLLFYHNSLALSVQPANLGEFQFDKDIICYIDGDNDFYHDTLIGGIVSKNKKVGLADKQGNLLIPTIYQDGDCSISHHVNYLSFKKDHHWGLVDFNNTLILDFKYDSPIVSFDGTDKFVVSRVSPSVNKTDDFIYDEKQIRPEYLQYAVIDKQGNVIINWQDNPLYFLTPKLLRYHDKTHHDLSGIIDLKGNVKINAQYALIDHIGKDRFHVSINDSHFVIDINNNKLSQNYDEIHHYNKQGYARVFNRLDNNTQLGFIDTHGKLIIPMKSYAYPAWNDVFAYQYDLDIGDNHCRIYLTNHKGAVNDPHFPDINCQSFLIKPTKNDQSNQENHQWLSWLYRLKHWFMNLI